MPTGKATAIVKKHQSALKTAGGSEIIFFPGEIQIFLSQNCPPGCHRILPEQLQVLSSASLSLSYAPSLNHFGWILIFLFAPVSVSL